MNARSKTRSQSPPTPQRETVVRKQKRREGLPVSSHVLVLVGNSAKERSLLLFSSLFRFGDLRILSVSLFSMTLLYMFLPISLLSPLCRFQSFRTIAYCPLISLDFLSEDSNEKPSTQNPPSDRIPYMYICMQTHKHIQKVHTYVSVINQRAAVSLFPSMYYIRLSGNPFKHSRSFPATLSTSFVVHPSHCFFFLLPLS